MRDRDLTCGGGDLRPWGAVVRDRLLGSPGAAMLIAVGAVVFVGTGSLGWLLDWRLGVDSAVYRSGAVALLRGDPLYDGPTLNAEPYWALLPFTYPPTAALLFLPLAVVPTQVAWGLLAAASVFGLAVVVRLTLARTSALPDVGRYAVVLTLLLLALEPVWRTIFLGQVNLVLMTMVVVDVLVLAGFRGARGRYAGVLIGAAAAIKLTPLIFVVHLALTGNRPAAARAVGTFAGLQGLLFLLSPHDAARFWGHSISDPGRTGPLFWNGNQSLNGLVNRLSELAPWSMEVAIGIGAVLAAPAVLLVLWSHRAGRPVQALLVTAFYGLLVSPVSWSHHYVWAVPLIVVLLARMPAALPSTRPARIVAALALVAVFCSGILLFMRNGRGAELTWAAWEYLPGSAYLLVPLVAGLVMLARLPELRSTGGPAESAGKPTGVPA